MDQTPPTLPSESRHPQVTIIVVPLRLRGFDLEVGHRDKTNYGTTLITGHPAAHESLDESARRIVTLWIGDNPQYLEQLYTLSSERTSGREVAVSYVALFRASQAARADDRMTWTRASSLELSDDVHRKVFDYALVRLKAKLGYTNIAFHLLPPRFTLSELQSTYEHVLGHPVDKRNFRRRMAATGTLVKSDQLRRDGSHRPAALYEFAIQDDPAAYLTPSWAAASFQTSHDDFDD